jgi:hypothetical protein
MKAEEKKDVNRILVEDRHLIDEALKGGRPRGDAAPQSRIERSGAPGQI